MKKDERFHMRVSPEFTAILDDWRRTQPDIPSRAESIRRLVYSGYMFASEDVSALIDHATKQPTKEIAAVVRRMRERAEKLSGVEGVPIIGDTPAEQLAEALLKKPD